MDIWEDAFVDDEAFPPPPLSEGEIVFPTPVTNDVCIST